MASSLFRSLFLMALAHLALEMGMNFLPVIYPVLIATWDISYAQIGLIPLVLAGGASLMQPVFGYLSDRWGASRMTVLSIAWMGLMMGLIGFAPNYLSLLLLVGLGALGSAAFHPAGATLASISGGKKRGTAVSVFSVGGNLGTALSPLWMAVALGWLGLRGTVLLIPMALLTSLILHLQLRGSNWTSGNLAAARHSSQELAERGSVVGLILITITVMCRSWVQIALVTYLPEWMQSQGFSLAAAGWMLSLLLVAVGLGSLTGGSLSDRIGRWQVMALSIGLMGPALWFFLMSPGLAQLGVMGVLIGLSFPVSVVMAQEAWPKGVGLASALVMGLGWAPGGLGASVTGLAADRFSLDVSLQLLILPPLLGLVAILAFAALQHRSGKIVQPDAALPKK